VCPGGTRTVTFPCLGAEFSWIHCVSLSGVPGCSSATLISYEFVSWAPNPACGGVEGFLTSRCIWAPSQLPAPTPGAFSTGHTANWTYTGPAAVSFELRAGGASWTVPYSATARSSVWTGRGIPVGRHMLQIRTLGSSAGAHSDWVNLGYVTVLADPGNPGLSVPMGVSEGVGVRRDERLWYDRVLLWDRFRW